MRLVVDPTPPQLGPGCHSSLCCSCCMWLGLSLVCVQMCLDSRTKAPYLGVVRAGREGLGEGGLTGVCCCKQGSSKPVCVTGFCAQRVYSRGLLALARDHASSVELFWRDGWMGGCPCPDT
jgi:hypothetical protein